MQPRAMRRLVAAACFAALAACAPPQTNFSQRAGFDSYFAANPPRREAPSDAERALLARYAPRFMLPPGHAGLIGFYEDYIAHGRLLDGDGRVIARDLGRDQLNAVRDQPRVEFVHEPASTAATPVVLGRVEQRVGPEPDGARWTYLTYSAVFRVSGLPSGMARWEELALGVIADLQDWHQLDHYTAATLAFDQTMRPVALTLQQHNGHRTYLIGRDLPWPADGRLVLDVAIRSNELYAHREGRTLRRAIPMPNPDTMRYLVTGLGKPWLSADDITDPRTEATYRLDALPHDDAFYGFKGFLGERRRLQGRSGPPGADYNIGPSAKGKTTEMLVGYWREDDAETLLAIDEAGRSNDFALRFAELRREQFLRDLACVRRGAPRC